MLTGELEFVIGVDTHKYRHAAALVDAVGGVRDELEVASDGTGEAQLLAWAQRTQGHRVWAVEGTGSFGAGLTRRLLAAGETVYEVDRPRREPRRDGAKSDSIDAIRAARSLLASENPARPRCQPDREAIRVLLVSRSLAVNSHRTYLCQLKGELIHLPAAQRERLQKLPTTALLRACRQLRAPARAAAWEQLAAERVRRLAQRCLEFEADARQDQAELQLRLQSLAPQLLNEFGISAVLAAEFYNAWVERGRIRSEAAFAKLCGVAPIPASSGEHVRYRLNRGGDRRLNRALHQAVLCRLAYHPPTQQYAARRLAEGRTKAEIRRCLKRYLARRVYHLLEASAMA
jgi:hypothetical protein